jgi:hypothetical protein
MIREITCNKEQPQMIILKLVGGPESYRHVGTAMGSWSPHWPVTHQLCYAVLLHTGCTPVSRPSVMCSYYYDDTVC